MKVKCYAIYEGDKEIVSEYANVSQKNFLDFELRSVLKRIKKSERIQFQNTSNGVWYSLYSSKTHTHHLILLNSESASLSLASTLISKGIEFEVSKLPTEKIRLKLAEQIKMFNANSKVDILGGNVVELENIMKGNVSKIITNMSDLEGVEKKSQMMSSLSMQLEKDSRELEKKMKKKQCIQRMIGLGVVALIAILLVYYFFL